MQDGASPPIAWAVKALLRAYLRNDRVILRRFQTTCSPGSADVNPFDIWLWEILKNRMYTGSVGILPDLKAIITDYVDVIDWENLFLINYLLNNLWTSAWRKQNAHWSYAVKEKIVFPVWEFWSSCAPFLLGCRNLNYYFLLQIYFPHDPFHL